MGIGLEPLSCNDTVPINYEQTLFQALVNEGRVSDVVIVCLSNVNLTWLVAPLLLTQLLALQFLAGLECQQAAIRLQRLVIF